MTTTTDSKVIDAISRELNVPAEQIQITERSDTYVDFTASGRCLWAKLVRGGSQIKKHSIRSNRS